MNNKCYKISCLIYSKTHLKVNILKILQILRKTDIAKSENALGLLKMLKICFLVFDFYAIIVSICKSNTFYHLLIKVITKNYYAGMLLIFQFVENETY